jgi:hypothetical protein
MYNDRHKEGYELTLAEQLGITERDVAPLIGDAETMRNRQNAMRRYIIEVFDGYYDMNQVNRRLRIGKVHKRIGVTPRLYLASSTPVEKRTVQGGRHAFGWPGQIVFRDIPAEKCDQHPANMFDTTLIIDTCTDALVQEAESARQQMEEHAEQLEQVVAERTYQLEEISHF